MAVFDFKMYAEACSSLHASEDTLNRVMKKAAGTGKMKRRFLPVFAALLILTVSVITFAGGGVSRGAWIFHGTLKECEKMGVYCPERLGPYRMDEQDISRCHVVSAETDMLKAFFRPDYIWMSVTYKKNSRQSLSVSFGAMDHPLWACVSDFDMEHAVWNEILHPESLSRHNETEGSFTYIDHITEHTYRNCTVYLYDEITEYTDSAEPALPLADCRHAYAVWTDPDAGIWFRLCSFDSPWETEGESSTCIRQDKGVTKEELFGYAKEIIDSCR